MGTVVDETLAFSTCLCYQVGPSKSPEDILCYSPGVIGTLSNIQDTKCSKSKFKKASKLFLDQQARFGKVSKACAIGNKFKKQEITDIVMRSECILAKFGGK